MAHKHGYLTLKNKNAKDFMKMVGKNVTVIVKGKVTEARMETDYEDGPVPIGFGTEQPKDTPRVEIDVKTASIGSKKKISEMTDNEFEHEIVDAKTGD